MRGSPCARSRGCVATATSVGASRHRRCAAAAAPRTRAACHRVARARGRRRTAARSRRARAACRRPRATRGRSRASDGPRTAARRRKEDADTVVRPRHRSEEARTSSRSGSSNVRTCCIVASDSIGGVVHDGECVALERRLREHVDGRVVVASHGRAPGDRVAFGAGLYATTSFLNSKPNSTATRAANAAG